MPEYLDVFDVNMNPIDPFKMDRKEVHEKGIWHQTFHCWILKKDPTGNKILLQLRSKDKENHPNKLDISAAGHLSSGEVPLDGLREVEEELGITVNEDKFLYLGVLKQATDQPQYCNREFCHTYFYETDHLLSDYKPQMSEVDGLFEINISDGLKLFSEETPEIEAQGIVKKDSSYIPKKRMITTSDMASENDRYKITNYYLKIFILADLFFKGHRPLAI